MKNHLLRAARLKIGWSQHVLDACTHNAHNAFILAQSAGSNKIISRVKVLHGTLVQSKWRKDRCVTDLSRILMECE
ncbi:hypothetical protein [Baia soyae]|uniref:Uncharacterized protein n=1 Tax=Baia soyae TaxID=1544746 RepID=A0A4R2S4L7_9BACL|nr:hypothetical protein [Baia soyae]TCP70732.1 hypothetical protein EDD57_101176 [Baia soyae]